MRQILQRNNKNTIANSTITSEFAPGDKLAESWEAVWLIDAEEVGEIVAVDVPLIQR